MKHKLIGAAAFLGAAASFVILVDTWGGHHEPETAQARLKQPLISSAQLVQIDSVHLQGVDLIKDDTGRWSVKGQDGRAYRADAQKIARLLDDAARIRIQDIVARRSDGFADLGLTSAKEVTLKSKGKDLLVLRIGKDRPRGGQYVAFGKEDVAYLTDAVWPLQTEFEFWELKTLLNVKAGQIKSVAFTPAKDAKKKPIALSREATDKPWKTASGKDATASGELDSALSGVVFAKRLPKSDKTWASESRAEFQLFDGSKYVVRTGRLDGKTHIVIEGGELASLMAANDFEVSDYIGERFRKGAEDFAPHMAAVKK